MNHNEMMVCRHSLLGPVIVIFYYCYKSVDFDMLTFQSIAIILFMYI